MTCGVDGSQTGESLTTCGLRRKKSAHMAELIDAVRTNSGGMALYFAETQRSEAAKLSLAVALQVGEGDPGPLDVSFLTGLVQKSFAVLLSQEKAKEEEDPSSLIVKP